MSFAEPITLTVDSVALDFQCQDQERGRNASTWFHQGVGYEVTLKIRHTDFAATATKNAMRRHNVELTRTIYETVDTLADFEKDYYTFERKPGNVDVLFTGGLLAWLATSPVLTKLLASES